MVRTKGSCTRYTHPVLEELKSGFARDASPEYISDYGWVFMPHAADREMANFPVSGLISGFTGSQRVT